MKDHTSLLSMTIPLLTFVLFGGHCYAQNYVPTANEEFYGTWINDKTINAGHIQKKISTPGGNKDYLEVSDSVPVFEDEQQVYAKWTDTEGNIWYKIFGTVKAGAYKGTKWQELDKLSKSATVWEYVFAIVSDFNPNSYPTKVVPKELNYRIFYRSEEKYVPKPNEELYGTWTNEQNFGDNFHPRKVVVTADGYAGYFNIPDSVPLFTWSFSIDKKWTDSDGNVWYKILGTGVGTYEGIKSQELYKLSKSGTIMERAWVDLGHGEFDPSKYPTEIDPKSYYYRILYRADTTPVDERFGTWTNEKSMEFQKIVWDAQGYREYFRVSDKEAVVVGASEIVSKWKDSEGNTWFKLFDTVVGGPYKGWKFYALLKVSKSGTVQELVYHRAYGEFDPKADFPAIDPKDRNYNIYYRTEE